MKQLILASNNKHKIEEIKQVLKDYEILSLENIGFTEDIVEDGATFEENALIKARTIAKFSGKDVIADDSGLCIDLLDGRPGIYSARYSKEGTAEKNIDKVLDELNGRVSPASFVSVIAYVSSTGKELTFRGEYRGKIITERRGNDPFGYNPIFYVPHLDKTFGELPQEIKTSINHRKISLDKLAKYLTTGQIDEN